MFTIALRMVRDENETYDVVQETFIQVFNNLHQFRFKSTLGAWIKAILVREALRKIKPAFSDIVQPADRLEQVVWPDDLSGDYLQKAVMDLPDGYRLVFTLVEIEGYSHKEVAQIMNITEGTSKSQLYYAKKNLQKRLIALANKE